MNELDMIRGLLEEAPPSADVISEGRRRIAEVSDRPRSPRARLALSGAGLAAAAAGAIMAVYTLVPAAGKPSASPSVSSIPAVSARAHSGLGTTPSEVLRKAALAALEVPAGAPTPGQFVYTKLYRQGSTGVPGGIVQTWASADGARLGLVEAGNQSAALPACRNGFWVEKPVGKPAQPSKLHCDPAQNAAYRPTMPTSPAALRRYLLQQFGLQPGNSGGLLISTEDMVATGYLAPVQRAAIYRLLAQTTGLSVVPHATNVKGQKGVGVRSGIWKGATYTIIFDRRTFAPLGMNWTVLAGPQKGAHGGEVVLKKSISDNEPLLP